VLAWLGLNYFSTHHYEGPQQQTSEGKEDEYEMVEGNLLPKEPSAVVVTDQKGKMKWTVSIPQSYDFPLRPAQYAEICMQSHEVSDQLASAGKGSGKTVTKRHRNYYTKDPYYMDVAEAEEQGLLPSTRSDGRPKGRELIDVADLKSHVQEQAKDKNLKVCEKSMTYVMETSDAGMGKTLISLWTSYGLAQKEGRAFFVDDTRW
jgi:hypothetical protein